MMKEALHQVISARYTMDCMLKEIIKSEIITGKYKGSAHKNCNLHLSLTKKIPVIFHNLKGYDSHLIMQEIGKFDVKIDVIPNGLKKYMTFTINRFFFVASMQFINSSLNALFKNLSDNKFR